MYFWLIYSDRNNHMERIAIAVKNVVNCCVKYFFMASEILEQDQICLFLYLDYTLIDENEYLESVENAEEFIAFTE